MNITSWRTTLLGVLTALALIAPQLLALLDGNPETTFDLSAILAALGIGGTGYLARDNSVTSEAAGAK